MTLVSIHPSIQFFLPNYAHSYSMPYMVISSTSFPPLIWS